MSAVKKSVTILIVTVAFYSRLHCEIKSASSDPFLSISKSTSSKTTPALRLGDCFNKALIQSEFLKNKRESIEQSEAKARNSLGGALPDLRWLLTDLIQDTRGVQGQGGGVGGTLTRRERIEHRFHLEQPIFSGFREISATKGFNKESGRDQFLLKRAEFDLFLDVAIGFYNVILSETRLRNTQSTLKVSRERTLELKERAKLGKTRESEVLTAESQSALLKAREISHSAEVSLTREYLSMLIGENIEGSSLIDEFPSDLNIPNLDDAIEQGKNRTDVQALEADVQAKRLSVRYERGSYWPTLDLAANYYTRRVGFQNGINWDALLSLDVPLYQGGSVAAQVRRALSELRQSENLFSLKLRQVASQIRQAHINLISTIEEAKALEEAVRTAKKSYELHVKEYRLGLVSNLEVLAAMNAELEDKQSLDDAYIRQKINYLKLKIEVEDNVNL